MSSLVFCCCFSDVASFWSPPKLLGGLYALLLIEILVWVYYCTEKNWPQISIVCALIVQTNFVKTDQNFAVKALGCAPWFPSLVSLLFVAAPSGAMKLEPPISVRCHFDVKFKFSPNHALCPARTISSKPKQKPYNKSFIDQACSVKMAGYWPCSFLRVYGPRLRLGP